MSTAGKYIPNYSVDDYARWKGDWELLDGIPVAMTPSATVGHQRLAMRLSGAFYNALQSKDCRDYEVLYAIDWHIDKYTVVRPDVIIVCDVNAKAHIEYAPVLITEVLSPSTVEKDLTVKFHLYQQQGVRYYLIADPERKSLKVYGLIDGQYVELESANVYPFQLEENCVIELPVDTVFN